MKHALALASATVALTAAAVSAHAGCVDPRVMHSAAAAHTIPAITLPKGRAAAPLDATANASRNIVGTWVATYTNGGSPAGQAIIQWHSDGTEWENINFPVLGGNMCLGSWKAVSPFQVARTHMGWLYDNGNLFGYFIETETNSLSDSNHYSGTNTTTGYDSSGNQIFQVSGTSSAVRFGP